MAALRVRVALHGRTVTEAALRVRVALRGKVGTALHVRVHQLWLVVEGLRAKTCIQFPQRGRAC